MKPELSDSELERIRTHIAKAEVGTSGEIVPYVVWSSDDYEVVMWRSAALFGSLFLLLALVVFLFYSGWGLGWLYTGIGVAGGVLAAGLLGALFTSISPAAFRALAGRGLLARRVRARAEQAFIDEGVFRTRAETGILILVSLRERRIEIVADSGISARIPASRWTEVVDAARGELRNNNLANALVSAVDVCGDIIRAAGLIADDDDENELGDDLRVGPN